MEGIQNKDRRDGKSRKERRKEKRKERRNEGEKEGRRKGRKEGMRKPQKIIRILKVNFHRMNRKLVFT